MQTCDIVGFICCFNFSTCLILRFDTSAVNFWTFLHIMYSEWFPILLVPERETHTILYMVGYTFTYMTSQQAQTNDCMKTQMVKVYKKCVNLPPQYKHNHNNNDYSSYDESKYSNQCSSYWCDWWCISYRRRRCSADRCGDRNVVVGGVLGVSVLNIN